MEEKQNKIKVTVGNAAYTVCSFWLTIPEDWDIRETALSNLTPKEKSLLESDNDYSLHIEVW